MNPRQKMEARLAELRAESRRCVEQRGALIDAATEEKRGLSEAEQASYDAFTATRKAAEEQIPAIEARITELAEAEQRGEAAASTTVLVGAHGEQRTSNTAVTDPPVYVKGNVNGNSYFRDLGKRALNPLESQDATDRLVRSGKIVAAEQRALGNTNTTGGSGGEFAPPTWLVNEWINLLRPGRVTADLFKKAPVPMGTSSISIPKLTGGTSVALQTTQNTTVTPTDPTTGFVSTGFTTILGKEVISQQLIDQTALPFDEVISADLAAAYNAYFGAQVILGAGVGANNNSVLNGLLNVPVLAANQAVLAASPTPQAFYSKANGMLASFVTNRFVRPDTWIMHPRRWYWLMAQVDTQGRPLVVPADNAFNPMMTNNDVADQGPVGRFLGCSVVVDPNIPINLGTGTNQDTIFLIKRDDLWLFESSPRAEVFTAPYAESLGVLFRLYNYAGLILNRLNSSIATMNGAGLATPSF